MILLWLGTASVNDRGTPPRREPAGPARCHFGMGNFKPAASDRREMVHATTLAKALAPEDILVGDYVMVLQTVSELPSCLWAADAVTLSVDEPVRIHYLPSPVGLPLRVDAVCLPFVLVKRAVGNGEILDIRQCRLARVDRQFAKSAWKTSKKPRKARKRKKRKHLA